MIRIKPNFEYDRLTTKPKLTYRFESKFKCEYKKTENPYFIVKITFMMCILHSILDGSLADQRHLCVFEFSMSHKKRVKTNHQLYNINKQY